MAHSELADQGDQGITTLTIAHELHSHPDRVAQQLADGGGWLGDPLPDQSPPGLRRFAVDLRLQAGGAGGPRIALSKAAYLDLGVPVRRGNAWEVEISWRASSIAPLFPVFSGRLTIGPHHLRLDGFYAPPAGVLGRTADRMLLNIAASGTARWLLRQIDEEAGR